MAAELRCSLDWDALLYARSRVVHAAAAAELDVLDVPFLDLSDLKGLEQEALKAKTLGLQAKVQYILARLISSTEFSCLAKKN